MEKIVVIAGMVGLAACGSAVEDSSQVDRDGLAPGPPAASRSHAPVCPGPAREGDARCHSRVILDADGNPFASSEPPKGALTPADLWSAYSLPAGSTEYPWPSPPAGSPIPTIAIVDAFDDPTAESDLAVYRATFGLPPCTTSNGCFRKVDQNGGTNYPRKDSGWALEISLDLDMASAICPTCKILLVEAKSNSFANMMAAVDHASQSGVVAISNSYGANEFSGETGYEWHFDHSGIAITVSSGDGGYGVEYPAASQYVTAVGGTSLACQPNVDPCVRVSEKAWSGAGSGCSAYVLSKPAWQTDTGCSRRTVADVSAVADPNTGVAVYDTTRYMGQSGWFQVGGTSVSSPIIAGVYALAGNAGSTLYGSYPYSNASSLFDVTAGSNGNCGGSYLCTAVVGYDGPTGLGTPNGTSAF